MNQRELKRILSFTGFGFASGLPYVLVFITLTAWLRSEGLDLSVIGFFGWITLTYSLKFLWAPFVDRFSIPVLSNRFKKKLDIINANYYFDITYIYFLNRSNK